MPYDKQFHFKCKLEKQKTYPVISVAKALITILNIKGTLKRFLFLPAISSSFKRLVEI